MPYNSPQKLRKNNEDRVAKGLCRDCNQPRESSHTNSVRCNACAKKRSKYMQELRKRSKVSGLCSFCHKNPVFDNGGVVCENCWYDEMARSSLGNRKFGYQLKELLIKQNYTCPYTGRKLIPKQNASIDHVVPLSRGGLKTIDNVQWVDWTVNRMKYNMTPEEFLLRIQEILTYRIKR